MSPVPPPPAGAFVPSEDWSNDDSFDFGSPSLSSSPSRPHEQHAKSPGHRPRLSGTISSSSPLRQSYAQPPLPVEDDEEDGFDFNDAPAGDGTDSFPAFSRTPSVTMGTMGTVRNLHLAGTVVGSGPNGVGTITKLVLKSQSSALPKGSIRMKNAAVAKAWEDDLDLDDLGFEDGGNWKDKLVSKSGTGASEGSLDMRPAKDTGKEMPGADALDGFDDLEEEDREATLKASATLKARLPPPRPKTASTTTPPTVNTEVLDLADDADFDLPLNLTNLNLASRSSSSSTSLSKSKGAGPRSSMASSDWDSGGAKTDWWSENGTPSHKRLSETSGTSISDGLSSAKGKSKAIGSAGSPNRFVTERAEEEEDMEEGLVMPTKLFFATTSKRELDHLLDRKRKPQFASVAPQENGDMTIRGSTLSKRVEEGMEDGLVFEDPGRELTMNRLTMGKKARSRSHIPIAIAPKRSTTSTPSSSRIAAAAVPGTGVGGARYPSHDILGRTGLPSLRERTQSLASICGHGHGQRSHSAGNVPSLHPARTTETPPPSLRSIVQPSALDASPSKGIDHYRSRSGQLPPTPSVPSTPSRGLRHQKSHHLLTSPSPAKALSKKQSLSSLTPAIGLHTLNEDGETPLKPQAYASASSSRLTMPTSSSKAKTRPPISSVFPMLRPASSPPQASMSTRSKLRHAPDMGGGMRVKRRDWGDGTELEGIEDLEVEAIEEKEKKSSWSKSRSKLVKEKRSQIGLSPDKRSKTTSATRDKETATTTGKDGAGSWGRKKKRPPLLIKHLGSVDQRKVVGEMTWNPVKLRWEGNETALRDFDNIPISTSARPALITHISSPNSPSAGAHHFLDNGNTGGSRIVGDMRFDPVQMRWISLSPDEEPDPFEGLADDEDEEGGGTIRASRKMVMLGLSEASESLWSTSRKASEAISAVSVLGSSASTTDSGSGSVGEVFIGHGVDLSLISDELRAECVGAEERHKRDMRGWVSNGGSWSRSEARREEKRLWDIRHLALKS